MLEISPQIAEGLSKALKLCHTLEISTNTDHIVCYAFDECHFMMLKITCPAKIRLPDQEKKGDNVFAHELSQGLRAILTRGQPVVLASHRNKFLLRTAAVLPSGEKANWKITLDQMGRDHADFCAKESFANIEAILQDPIAEVYFTSAILKREIESLSEAGFSVIRIMLSNTLKIIGENSTLCEGYEANFEPGAQFVYAKIPGSAFQSIITLSLLHSLVLSEAPGVRLSFFGEEAPVKAELVLGDVEVTAYIAPRAEEERGEQRNEYFV